MRPSLHLALTLVLAFVAPGNLAGEAVKVRLETSMGNIDIALAVDKAPASAGSFLAFVDAHRYDGEGFYRVVRPDNDNGDPAISVIQGGVLQPDSLTKADFVEHETTSTTGLRHVDGTVSLARGKPGTGGGGMFFICNGDQPSLDFGASRYEDGQGFAAFGQVISGMDVVRAINAMTGTRDSDNPYMNNQILSEPVIINRAYRLTNE